MKTSFTFLFQILVKGTSSHPVASWILGHHLSSLPQSTQPVDLQDPRHYIFNISEICTAFALGFLSLWHLFSESIL
jgi:hypothetical protein